jgi:acyl carrier protein
MNTVMEELEKFITREILKQPKRTLTPTEPLISSGMVDSFSLMDISLFAEKTFGVRIEDSELNSEAFDTLEQLASLITSRQ